MTTAAPAWVGAAASKKAARRTARIGPILPSARIAVLSLTDALPVYHHHERHAIRVAATPERALAAAREARLEDAPLVRRAWLRAAKRRAESA
jgi:hypothetical protein